MPAYQRTYPNVGTLKGKATRIICSWCKKLEKVGEEWVRVSAITEEEKVGYRCCPACDTKKRSERLPDPPIAPMDTPKIEVTEITKPALLPPPKT